MRLYGKNPVFERLKYNPRSIKKIYLQVGLSDAGYVYKKAKKWNIPIYAVPKTKIAKLARNLNTQGLVADVDAYEYLSYEDLLEQTLKKKHALVFLDGLNDPQNLGAIIRSLACLGGFSLVLPSHDSVNITESVLHVACGGDNYVGIAKVANLGQAIEQSKKKGFWIAGAVVKDGNNIFNEKLNFPLGIVIGSEQKGIRDAIRRRLDFPITIPMSNHRLAMNVAHATAIFCYEVIRQKSRA
ncbi:MAG: 23S rRNA (guanosine(2251)-2'-O)-methyltransferase RlmB [Candidatus Omnitrophica bacterium]|nr:23S rRNA (guanosine(2251)-2'-O)-methyltransferase RlmB [Candidatus Omnitrophota bacterium]